MISQSDTVPTADQLFETFVTSYDSGYPLSIEEMLAQCPVEEREKLRDAIAGYQFAFENYFACDVSEELVQSAMEKLKQVRRRRQLLAEARMRAATYAWEKGVTEPLLSLTKVLYPALVSANENSTVSVLNRSSAVTSPTSQGFDPLTKRTIMRFARREAERLLERTGASSAPISLDAISEQLGLFVQETALPGNDGCLITDGESGGILLDTAMPRRRRRYTHAHEIGHFMLHRRSQQKFEDKRSDIASPSSRIEFEASAFASYLLMPSSLLPDAFSREAPDFAMADAVSEQFDVSLMAVLRRLVQESSHRAAFVCIEGDNIKWFDVSSLVEADTGVVGKVSRDSAAHALIKAGAEAHSKREVPASIWFDKGSLVDQNVTLIEESRFFDTGYVYTILNVRE